jgi:hypothetical protein
MSHRPTTVPQTKSGQLIKAETFDRLHRETQAKIEKLPKNMTRTFSNPPVSKPKSTPAGQYKKLDKGLKNY